MLWLLLLTAFVNMLVQNLGEAFLKDIGLLLVRRWLTVYTGGLPRSMREIRRSNILSYYKDLVDDLDKQRYPPKAIGIQVISNVLRGMPGYIAWRFSGLRLRATRLLLTLAFGRRWLWIGTVRRRRARSAQYQSKATCVRKQG